jgi:hypothetical protein
MSEQEVDWGAMGVDPNDLKRWAEAKPAKKRWRRQFIKFPWAWMDRLRGNHQRLDIPPGADAGL